MVKGKRGLGGVHIQAILHFIQGLPKAQMFIIFALKLIGFVVKGLMLS
jgi:hypothetical protein